MARCPGVDNLASRSIGRFGAANRAEAGAQAWSTHRSRGSRPGRRSRSRRAARRAPPVSQSSVGDLARAVAARPARSPCRAPWALRGCAPGPRTSPPVSGRCRSRRGSGRRSRASASAAAPSARCRRCPRSGRGMPSRSATFSACAREPLVRMNLRPGSVSMASASRGSRLHRRMVDVVNVFEEVVGLRCRARPSARAASCRSGGSSPSAPAGPPPAADRAACRRSRGCAGRPAANRLSRRG